MKFSKLRENKLVKSIALFIVANMLTQLAFPTVAMALTSGPSTPEVQSFEPVGTTDMVDLFTGDFTYNVPLFELPGPNGGYPFNLSYHSGIGMDQEASWTGLGWNINPGSINRSMRGLPDDFKGDEIKVTTDMKDNITFGAGYGVNGEIFGADLSEGVSGSIGLELKIYYNNYKGVGYSFSPNFGIGHKPGGLGAGIGISLDSQQGVGANASISVTAVREKGGNTSFNAGIGFNSKNGLDISSGLSVSQSSLGKENGKYVSQGVGDTRSSRNSYSQGMGGGSSFSFSTVSYTPVVSLPMRNRFVDLRFKTGTAAVGVFPNISIPAFYSTEYLQNGGKEVVHKAFGYRYLDAATEEDLLDFNRSKDGIVRKESPNLAIPQLTYDYYNVMGQGIGGMYRPYRSDIGVLHDPLVSSNTFGGAGGVDLGPSATPHIGINASITGGVSRSGMWKDDNALDDYYAFVGPDGNPSEVTFESVYYKAHGELTSFPLDEMAYIGGEAAVRVDLKTNPNDKIKVPLESLLVGKNGNTIVDATTQDNIRRPIDHEGRMPRNMSVQPITNLEMGGGTTSSIGEYKVNYYSGYQDPASASIYSTDPANPIARNVAEKENHIGGITSVNADGVRYVYGLPAYNNTDKEYIFSVGAQGTGCSSSVDVPIAGSGGNKHKDGIYYEKVNTNNYFEKTELPAYTYSHLLTSILGTDYVDVNGNGPDDVDLGYWVKFNYVKTNEAYQWRAPFAKANYNKGLESTAKDNTGAFKYGTKEVYHLATAETKTHIAVFQLSDSRSDGIGAAALINNDGARDAGTSAAFKLEKISLFVKNEYKNNTANAIPIKEVHFRYSQSLCLQTPNAATGKLTLKSLWFTHQNNNRGQLTPYIFDYNESSQSYNPVYSRSNYDRWGNYKGLVGTANACDYLESPYVQQFVESYEQNFTEKNNFKAIRDQQASAWHLSKITLPTGGTIKVDFESDDYAYVQYKQAQQMFKIDRLELNNDNQIYDNAKPYQKRKVYFTLETPIKDDSYADQDFENRYIDGLHSETDGDKQLYYKIKVDLRDGFEEYISGYSNLETTDGWGLDQTSLASIDIDGTGAVSCFTQGYINLQLTDVNGQVLYHPFAAAAWQHMRSVQPDLLQSVGTLSNPGTNSASKQAQVKSLASIFPAISKMFKGYRKHAFDHSYAQTIDLSKSVIRLCSPDKKKFGGGQRVKQITLSDEWGEDPTASNASESLSTYGQVYDYTMSGDNGEESSGVAQYEPMIGGDENAMRYAKTYPESIKHFTDNNLFFEFPINESYFPAPVVGYRKVTVRSLAAEKVMDDNASGTVNKTPTTGVSVSEFYTAKEYPVFVDETKIQKGPYDLWVPIPFIGQIRIDNLTASQGYSIILNDMHGKPKSNTSYSLSIDGKIDKKVSSIRYEYKDKLKKLSGVENSVRELVNVVETINSEIPDPGNSTINTKTRIMGVEYEFFTDMRSVHSESTMGGVQFNTEVPISFIPVFVPWPTFNTSATNLNTIVTNKIIHKAGILDKVIVSDGQSIVETKNLLYDEQSGRALLSSITNTATINGNTLKYKYEIPAHWKYEKGMGAAYKNYGLSFTANITADQVIDNVYNTTYSGDEMQHLVPGDEFVYTSSLGGAGAILTYLGESKCNVGTHSFYYVGQILAPTGDFFLYRSGRRNQLSTNVSSILALNNPAFSITSEPCIENDTEPLCSTERYWRYKQPEFNQFVYYLKMLQQIIENTPDLSIYTIGTPLFVGTGSIYEINWSNSQLGAYDYIAFTGGQTWFSIGSFGFNCGGMGQISLELLLLGLDLSDVESISTNNFLLSSTGEVIFQIELINNGGFVTLGLTHSPAGCSSLQLTEQTTAPRIVESQVSRNINIHKLNNVIQTSAVELSDNFNANTNYTPEGLLTDNTELIADAYQTGGRGIWRVKKSYNYFADRKGMSGNVDLSTDGTMDGVSFFNFEYPELFTICDPKWKLSNEITKYNSLGYEVENKNILGIYSSAKYDPNNSLPILVGSNVKFNEAYFESFEDNVYTTAESHTGKRSLFVFGGGAISYPTDMIAIEGRKMILSSWIKWPTSVKGFTNKVSLTDPGSPVTEVNGIKLEFKDANGNVIPNSIVIEPMGEVIEGWQKVEGEFVVPLGTISISIIPTAAIIGGVNQTVYFDDVRIFPSAGNIKTFVYDPITFRLNATLDENNYASFYYYDESGSLFLLKVETEEGVKTVQESRNHISE